MGALSPPIVSLRDRERVDEKRIVCFEDHVHEIELCLRLR